MEDGIPWTAVFVILLLVMVVQVPFMRVSSTEVREPLRIYSATMPFGVFSVKGDVSGGWGFTRGSIEGSEIYSIKFVEEWTLKTIILDATETPLIIDGTLQVVRIYERVGYASILAVPPFEDKVTYSNTKPRYEVHIPYLPEVDPLTEDWER